MNYSQLLAQLASVKENQGKDFHQAVAQHLVKAAEGVAVDPNANDNDNTSNPDGSTSNNPPPATAAPPPVTVNVNSAPTPPATPTPPTWLDRNVINPLANAITAPVPTNATTSANYTGPGTNNPNVINATPGLTVPPTAQAPVAQPAATPQLDPNAQFQAAQAARMAQAKQAPTPVAQPSRGQSTARPGTPDALVKMSEALPGQAVQEAAAEQPARDLFAKQTSDQTQLTNARSQDNLTQIQQSINDARRAIQQSDGTIDPNHFFTSFANKSTGQKILAGLSMFAGAFQGQGLLGGVKSLLTAQPLFQAIDQDAAAQRAAFEQHGKAAKAYMDLVKSLQDNGVPIKNANDIAEQNYKAQLEGATQASANKYSPPQVANALKDAFANRDTEGKVKLAAAQSAEAYGNTARAYAEARKADAEAKTTGNKLPNAVFDADGNMGMAVNEDHAKAYSEEAKPAQDLVTAVHNVQTLRQNPLTNRAALNGPAKIQLMSAIEGMQKSGTLSQRTANLMGEAAGDPGQLFNLLPGSNEDEKLNYLEAEGKGAMASAEHRHGVRWFNQAKTDPGIANPKGP